MLNKSVLIDSLKKLGSAKPPVKKKDMIIDPRGQWAHPGENTRIPSNQITMDAVPYPVYAQPNVGTPRMMYPEQEYSFPGASYVDEYPQMRAGGNKSKHVVVKPSKIQGADKGLFSNKPFRKNQLIGLAHQDDQPVGEIGHMHNHSDEPNMYSVKIGNQRYVYANRDIQPGEELTTNYRLQPELEQPEDFMRKGGSAPKLPRKKNSKGYSRSLEATNKFFAEHALFEKPKSRKNKIYDPNSKYYQDGGVPQNYDPSIAEDNTAFLNSMMNSPLFVERYARMVGKPVEEVGEEAEAYRQQMIQNLQTVGMGDSTNPPASYESLGAAALYQRPFPYDEVMGGLKEKIDALPKRGKFNEQMRQEYQKLQDETQKLKDQGHKLYFGEGKWTQPTDLHERSHASTLGELNVANGYGFRDMSNPRSDSFWDNFEHKSYVPFYNKPAELPAQGKDYFTQPTELKARKDVAAKKLQELGLYDPVNENFTEDHYKQLLKLMNDAKIDSGTRQQIRDIVVPFNKEDTIRMFNDMVQNDQQSMEQYAKRGGFKFQQGGQQEYNIPPTYQNALQNFVYPNVIADPRRTGYNSLSNTISYDPESPIENMDNDWWREHEMFHHLQNQAGGMSTSGVVGQRPNPYVASDESIGSYYDRRNADVQRTIDGMISENPELQFIPRNKLAEGNQPGFVGAEDLQYSDPSTLEGEAREYEQYIEAGNPSIFPQKQNGGPYNTDGPIAQEEYMEDYPVDSLPKIYGHEPEDYQKFLDYNQTAPENRRGYEEYKYGDPNSYDHYGMWDALGKPKDFQEALQMNPDWTPDEYDGSYHGFSVNPNTGVFLKSGKPGLKPGDTTWMEVAGHYLSPRADMDTPVFDPELGRFKYVPNDEYIETELTPEEIQEYAKGGYVIEDISVPSLNKAQLGTIVKSAKNLGRIANIGTIGTVNTLAKTLAPVMIHPIKIVTMGAGYDGLGSFTGSPLNMVPFYGKDLSQDYIDDTAFRKFGDTLDYVKIMKELDPSAGPLLRMGKSQIKEEGNWAEPGKPNESYAGVFGARFDTRVPGSDLGYISLPRRNGVLVTDAQGNFKPSIPISDPGVTLHRRLPFSNRYIDVNMDRLRNDQFDWRTQGGNLQSLLERYGYAALGAAGLGAMGWEEPREYVDEYLTQPLMKGLNAARDIIQHPAKIDDYLINPWNRKTGGAIPKAQNGLITTGSNLLRAIKPVQTAVSAIPAATSLIKLADFTNTFKPQDLNIKFPLVLEGDSGMVQLAPNTKNLQDNLWHFSASMTNPLEAGRAMLLANQVFPYPNPSILEPNSLSLDSYNMLLNMGRRKDWDMVYENDVPLNFLSEHSDLFKGLNTPGINSIGFNIDDHTADQMVLRLNDYLASKGLTDQAYRIGPPGVSNMNRVFLPNYKLTRKYLNGGGLPKKQGGGELLKYSGALSNLMRYTPGNALRAGLYRSINPASYNIKEKITGMPSEIFNTAFNNETRPFRVGMSLKYGTPEFLNTFLATKRITPAEYAKMPDSEKMMLHDESTRAALQDIGRRRLDAWAVGLKQPQEYNTLEQVGDNTYRMKDIQYTPEYFSDAYTDLMAQGIKDGIITDLGEKPLVTIAQQHYDRTMHPFMQRGVANNFMEQELLEKYQNASRSYIDQALGYPQYEPDPWVQQRHAGLSKINPDTTFQNSIWDNDKYGVMGGFRWDVGTTPEGMHWQANDVWDINPFERRSGAYVNPGATYNKLLHANYFRPLQNLEALTAVGGKPFNIQNNFLIDPVTFKPLKKWQKGGFLKRKRNQPGVVTPIEVLTNDQEAFPLPETTVKEPWYTPIPTPKEMTQEELDAYNKAYEEQLAKQKLELDKAAQPSHFNEGIKWVTDWTNSPMYNQMVLNSYNGNQANADYLTKLRKQNIATIPDLIISDNPADPSGSNVPSTSTTAAWSEGDTGQIRVFPSGYDEGPALYVHEGLHSSDRPRELYQWNHPTYKRYAEDGSSYFAYPDWMTYYDPKFPNEDVWHDRVMPSSDQRYISGHRAANWKDNELYKINKAEGWYTDRTDEELKQEMLDFGWSLDDPEFQKDFEAYKAEDKKQKQQWREGDKQVWKEFGHDYVSEPTEVRARLGEIRYNAQKAGVYDPFTEQITPEIFENFINLEDTPENVRSKSALEDLRQEFTDEEILWMLQNISKNDTEEASEFDQQTAKFGGAKRKLKRRQNGGPSATVEETVEEDPTNPNPPSGLTEAQQWISDWYKNRKLAFPEDDPRFAKEMMKILPAYNPESPILTNTTSFPQYVDDPSLGTLNPEGLNIGAAGTYQEGKEGSVIRLNPSLNPTQRADTEVHELTNWMMAPVRDKAYPLQSKVVEENILPYNDDWTDEQKSFYDYMTNYDEQNIQSYLNVARKNFGLKPDEEITPEKIQQMKKTAEEKGWIEHGGENFIPDIYLLFKMAKDEQGLSNLFNHIAQNDVNEDSMNYAKLGGAYELGDEVDEATMKRLKKLGYTFEKI